MVRFARPVPPAGGKEAFASLIDEEARRLGFVDANGNPDRRALALECGLAATTLVRAIGTTKSVSLSTLLALEKVTGVGVDEWRESLGLLIRPAVRVDTLSAAERRLLEFARVRGNTWINRTVDWLEAQPGERGDPPDDPDTHHA